MPLWTQSVQSESPRPCLRSSTGGDLRGRGAICCRFGTNWSAQLERRGRMRRRHLWATMHSSPVVKHLVGFGFFLALLMVSPVRHFRFGIVHSESLGGVISQMDLVLAVRSREFNSSGRQPRDFFLIADNCANDFVVNNYRNLLAGFPRTRVLDIKESRYLSSLLAITKGLEFTAIQHPRLRRHYCGSPLWEGLDGAGFLEDGRPWIDLPEIDVRAGWRELANIGVSRDQRIICFGVREASYWAQRSDVDSPRGLSDGGGSTQDFRNSDLGDYIPTIRWLLAQGFTVVRMGVGGSESRALSELGVVDYANSPSRSDFLDALLFSSCHSAFFGGGYGLSQLALAFKKPVCVVNYRPFIFTEWSTDICITSPSLMEDVVTKRRLSIDEMVRYPFNAGDMYRRRGLQFIPNSPREIQESVAELVARVDGTWLGPISDDLQTQFWDMVERSRPHFAWYPRPNGHEVRLHSRFNSRDLGVTRRRSIIASYFLQENHVTLLEPHE
jgi:putative glycosyltransferase (TIGR04372 family)